MRHLSTVGFSAIEAESFKALKLELRGNYCNVYVFASGAAFDGVSDLGSRHMIPASRHFRSSIFESSRGVTVGDEGYFSGASPCGASGESDEGGKTSARGGGDSVDLGGGEVRLLLEVLGKIWEGEPSDGGGGEAHLVGVLT